MNSLKRRLERFVPRRGGDGGTPPVHLRRRRGPLGPSNTDRILTGRSIRSRDAFEASLVPTRDVHDRAHAVTAPGKDGQRRLVSARALPSHQARPRLYHPSQMSSRGVAYDSVPDETYEREKWLRDEGVELHRVRTSVVVEYAIEMFGADAVRSMLRPRTKIGGMTPAEVELEREASRLLQASGNGGG